MMRALNGYFQEMSPCFECKERHRACHDTCESFKAWQARGLELKSKIKKEKARAKALDKVSYGYIAKNKKRKEEKWRKL